MLETGILVFLGIMGLAIKIPPKYGLRILAFPLAVDLIMTAFIYVLHFGTYSGLMTAAVAGVFCSMAISLLRYLFGYIYKDRYYPGRLFVNPKRLVL